jgi:hypothetical protein
MSADVIAFPGTQPRPACGKSRAGRQPEPSQLSPSDEMKSAGARAWIAEERELLEAYRRLDREGKAEVRGFVRGLA